MLLVRKQLPLLLVLLTVLFALARSDEDQEAGIPEGTTIIGSEIVDDEIAYVTPRPIGFTNFVEHFDDEKAFRKRWVVSKAKKDGTDESIAKYDGIWEVKPAEVDPLKGDMGLVLKSKAKHHAISAKLEEPFNFESRPFIVQYEVNFQNGQECGGAYIKLLTRDDTMDLDQFTDKTPYTIMFGPDKCGNDNKLHFIFRHRNPKNGTYEEKHCKRSTAKLEEYFKDKQSHLYTLTIKPDSSYVIMVDQTVINSGSLLEDFSPPVNPSKEIEDPNDRKPEDWDERPKIADPAAVKPEDWDEDASAKIPDPSAVKPEGWQDDEEENIPDPNAQRPTDWDDEMDGAWEPPLISNPKCEVHGCGVWKPASIDNPAYKGKWNPPLVENPKYRGKWEPRRIPNPLYYEDLEPYKMAPIGAVGLELWSMSENILFDNILITDDKYVTDHWAAETWQLKKQKADRESGNVFTRLINFTNTHPWLWAVYIVVIGIPVVMFTVFCCSSSPSDDGSAKKTDEASPDDLQEEKIDEEQEGEEEEEEQQGGDDKGDGPNLGERQNSSRRNSQEDSGEEIAAEEVEQNNEAGDANRSPRRRRPRKE